MSDDGLAYIELRPDLDYETVRANGAPARAYRGVFSGFSLPIFTVNEELYFTICVPNRYDEASDLFAHLYCWLAQAENNKNFKLQTTWEHFTPGDVVPNSITNVEVETATGAGAAQFQSYTVALTLVYGDLVANDILGIRLRRIAAVGAECVGDIVVTHLGVGFRRDKLGAPTP